MKKNKIKKIPVYWALAQLFGFTGTKKEAYKLWKESQ
jgi:hypothetical protein